MSRREEILEKVKEIPSLPTSATQVLHLLQNPDSSIQDITKAIEVDPGLTTDFLRLANSAYFAGPRQVATLQQAGVLFGTARIQQLVLASAVFPLVSQPLKGYDLPPGDLMNHSLAVAIGAEQLAKALNISAPQFTFTAGLLHDVGKIILGTFVAVDVAPIVKLAFEEQISFEKAEEAILGIDHAEVGAALLEAWHIPEPIVDAVRYHHSPDDYKGGDNVVDLIHVADNLGIECGLGTGIDGLNYRPSSKVVERLGLKTIVAEQVTCVMLSELQQITSMNVERGGGN